MCDDFLSVRMKFTTSAVLLVRPFEWPGAVPSNCWKNVTEIVTQLGGSIVLGWALSYTGPCSSSGRKIEPLYSRWVNHVLWCDSNGVLWDVTPHRTLLEAESFAWASTYFLPDDDARFRLVTAETCEPQPSMYVALRPEGEWTADCLCHAERAPRETQECWLSRALSSLSQAGFVPINCNVERAGDIIKNIWLMVE